MVAPIWRLNLQPASYNGVPFHVDVQAKRGGRRIVAFEFPKRELPDTEDMGRRIRRFQIAAYIIYSPALTPDYEANRDALIEALETEGPGLLILPTGLDWMFDEGQGLVVCDQYTVTEHRERGGWAEFEIEFYEAGQPVSSAISADTQGQVGDAAQNAITQFQGSSDIPSATPRPAT